MINYSPQQICLRPYVQDSDRVSNDTKDGFLLVRLDQQFSVEANITTQIPGVKAESNTQIFKMKIKPSSEWFISRLWLCLLMSDTRAGKNSTLS